MRNLTKYSLQEYVKLLASKQPVPGGGSAAALSASLGTALISMVGRYSIGKGKAKSIDSRIQKIVSDSDRIYRRLLQLADLDAKAYLKVVAARQGTSKQKKAARQQAMKVPSEVGHLCYRAIQLTPYLVKEGNKYLLSDLEVAAELLYAAFNSAMISVRANQG